MSPMISEPRDWQAEEDARTLAESKVIQNDKLRLDKAIQAANRIVEERKKEMSAMQSVASKKAMPKEQKEDNPLPSPSNGETRKTGVKRFASTDGLNVFKRL